MSTTDTTGIELRTSRVIRATPEDVWDAYTDAEKQTAWFSILDEEPGVVRIETDLRVGGTQTAVWGPSEDQLFTEVQTFLVIEPPHRLVTDSTGSSPDGQTMTTRIEVTFTAVEGGTRVDVVQTGFPVPELRDFFLTESWPGAFDRIEAYLTR
ncbi:SRPBCC family protein [Cellulomonas fimi]|uniref:Activator of Hsp90 ATPase 1 family protein n=1 Tax=Cellulomonas fimi (strain ATCC 484 / DSM 20113 / JCM 1341 / CCUG 24087 / LMG 16345 / NBRC 15513 / NCIMB 8980 / NCTC 7547 / NRS-133) TaxID=590998 RepID=F4H4U4_CELFA|nr:SRPBCC domain-containing protein [Cellulomonas fimi]AEE44295.1 Activator of Hsp90 ATPase 1 family protein [Cellulomonas fimi ATCC 484]NNH05742.1 SRPBCC domain-containing protein [Cellulomonas fimi]VEH26064.1 Activator of Hsp90 ATPase homolog 1-like protein [Cellulomonas fimi]